MKSDIDVWYWSLSVEFLPDSKRQGARGLQFDSLRRGLARDRKFFLSPVKVWDVYGEFVIHCKD